MSVSSPPALILNALRAGQIVAVMSEANVAELAKVLRRPAVRRYFTHSAITLDAFLAELRLHADLRACQVFCVTGGG